MRNKTATFRAIAFSSILIMACTKESGKTTTDSRSGNSQQETMPENLTVAGTVQLDTEVQTAAGEGSQASVEGQTVQLVNDDNEVIAEGLTTTGGAFTVNLNTTAMGLTQGAAAAPKIAKVRSLFLLPGEKADAVGTRQPILISPEDIETTPEGGSVLNAGVHSARKVGAIVGTITLETNESPVGIDVYIPGTTQIAKTDANGRFLIGFLQPGTFELRADKDGFNSLEWREVVVGLKSTTHLDASVMKISKGPKIEEFTLTSLDEGTGVAGLRIRLSGASRYRLGKVPDFSDAQFQPVDANAKEITVNQIIPGGIKLITFYLEAVDSDGLSVKSTITIDRDAPYLGSLSVDDDDALVASPVIALKPLVTNGTKMRLSETLAGLKTATWIAYATSHSHTLSDVNDGSKTIYVEYSDDAGNTTGAQGEIFTKFILDTTAPNYRRIELITPASPTGAFNTPLSWQSSYTESVEFDVEIYNNANYTGDATRKMTTTDTIVITNPAISSPGTYYWRVRARDLAGNASEWVTSGSNKAFVLKVLREAYQARKEVFGVEGKDVFLGRAMIPVGDLSGDGLAEIAVSAIASETTTCTNCGSVRIINSATGSTVGTFTENLDRNEGYGAKLTTCDLNNDGKDELIVSAPNAILRRNGYNYQNAGAVYVYNLATMKKIAEKTADIGTVDPAPGYSCWQDWDPIKNVSINRCGNFSYQNPLDGQDPAAAGTDSGRLFGQSIACARKSGADNLIVSEPQYQSAGMPFGRVWEFSLSGTTLSTAANATASTGWTRFGSAVAHLSNFNWAGGTCSAGETLAVGAPEEYQGTAPGRVHLYQKSGAAWQLCDSINPDIGDSWETGRFGARLFNLGDIDQDGSYEELAVVSAGGWWGGAVRILGGTTGDQLKSLKTNSDTANELGYIVAPAGDFDNDGKSELAISAPRARVNGVFDAGRVSIYKWDDINADDTGSDGAPLLELSHKPKGGSYLGASYVPIVSNGNINSRPVAMFSSSPGKSSGDSCAPPNPCPAGGAAAPGTPGSMGGNTGAYLEFAFLKLAPGLPLRLTGSSTSAGLGSSLASVDDIDGDSASDFIIGQSGARCAGRPYGALTVYSVLDGVFSKHICSGSPKQLLGRSLLYAQTTKAVVFSVENTDQPPPTNKLDLYAADFRSLMTVTNFHELATINPGAVRTNIASNEDYFISRTRPMSMTPGDQIVVGNQTAMSDTGSVKTFRVSQSAMTVDLTEQSTWNGSMGDKFGASVDFINDIYNPMPGMDKFELVIGAPGKDISGTKGIVYVIDDAHPMTVDGTDPAAFIKIQARDLKGPGEHAQEGFGSFVVGLPDFGDYADTVPFEADAYIYVANTNMRLGASSATPEYYIFAIKADGSTKMVKHETGTAGSMLGGYARLLPDINGDGVPDLAVSHPGGTGQLGSTGQVRILSGKGLTTPDASDDVMQVFYNPDASASNFGVSMEYGDITGDGVADFVVGANEFDTSAYQDAGAVYIFPMDSVK